MLKIGLGFYGNDTFNIIVRSPVGFKVRLHEETVPYVPYWKKC